MVSEQTFRLTHRCGCAHVCLCLAPIAASVRSAVVLLRKATNKAAPAGQQTLTFLNWTMLRFMIARRQARGCTTFGGDATHHCVRLTGRDHRIGIARLERASKKTWIGSPGLASGILAARATQRPAGRACPGSAETGRDGLQPHSRAEKCEPHALRRVRLQSGA